MSTSDNTIEIHINTGISLDRNALKLKFSRHMSIPSSGALVISLRKSISELDQLDEFKGAAVDCYGLAISAVGEHAVEIDPAQVAQFRSRMQSLRGQVKPDITAEQLRNVHASLSAELQAYSEKSHQCLERLREDIRAASEAVEGFAGNFAASGADLDVEVKRELQRLDKAARTAPLDELRGVIGGVVACIASSFERVKASNQLAIAQLKDEIRVLHKEIEIASKPRAAGKSAPTSAQHEVFTQIDAVRQRNIPFSVILVGVKNLRGLQSCYSKIAIENTLTSLHARLRSSIPGGSTSSRWNDSQFVAVVTLEPAAAMAKSRELAKELSGSYVVQDGAFQTVALEANAGVIDCKAQADSASLRRRLEQLSDALAN
jgi:GGDEF domain-containing protein